jgi:hypothetical protein
MRERWVASRRCAWTNRGGRPAVAATPGTIAANLDGSGGGEPVHGAGIEPAEITALIMNEAAKQAKGEH